MTHWTPESGGTSPYLYNRKSFCSENNDIALGLSLNMYASSKKITEVNSERVINEGVRASSQRSVDERFSYRSFPMFNISSQSTRLVRDETMNNVKVVDDDRLGLGRPYGDDTTGSPHIVVFKSDKGKAPMSSMANTTKSLKHSSSKFKEKVSDTSSFHSPLSDNHHMPISAVDAEGKRVWPAKGPEGFSDQDCATFSHTTSHSLGMRKAEVGLLKEKFNSNMLSGLLNFPARLGLGQQTQLRFPSSFTGSEGNDKVEVVKNVGVRIRNESSAETDTMDMAIFQEPSYLSASGPSGVNFLPLNLDILAGHDQQPSEPSTEEVEQTKDFTYLPGINAEILPSSPTVARSTDKTESSSSRTQSLGPEHMLSGSEQPCNPVPNPVSNSCPILEPGSRWLKRLRSSASDSFAVGTKCSSLGEALHHDKAKPFCSKFIEKISDRDQKEFDGDGSFKLNGHLSSLASSPEKDRAMLVSHSWIRRWVCNDQASNQQKKPAEMVTCEKETTKMVRSSDLKSRPFPSIAAMALMGKVMTGFEPCDLRSRGSFSVWNAKDI